MSISQKVLKGSLWSLALSWFNRSVGLISTIILLRILEPNDFGIVALATMVMLLFMSLCELGIRQYIIKTPNISDEMVNSAWTLQIIINLVITTLIFFSAPYMSVLLGSNELTDILRVIAFIPSIAALNNIGGTLLQKKLDFSKVTKVAISAKLISTPITIYIAVVYETYWALVLGNLASIILVCLFSYIYINYRPKFRFTDFKIILSETKWLLIGAFTGFIRAKIETFIINSKFGAEGVGLYDTSKEFAHLPLTDIISPASAPLLAGISSIETGLQDAYRAVLKYLYIAMFFILPSIVGIFMVGDIFVEVVMGPQWTQAIPIFKIVSILMVVFPLYSCCRIIMFLSNDLKILTVMDVTSIAVMITFLLPSYVSNLEYLAWGRVFIGIFFALALIAVMRIRYKFDVKPIFILFISVLIICSPFATCIHFLRLYLLEQSQMVILLITVIVGCVVYLATVLIALRVLSNKNEYFLFTREFIENNVNSIKRKCVDLLTK
jgi:O-antigen/teichoic acid export membrane protein